MLANVSFHSDLWLVSELTANQQISIDNLELLINTHMISLGTPRVVFFHRHIQPSFFLNHIVILVSSGLCRQTYRGVFTLLVFVFCGHFQVLVKTEPIRCVVVCKTGKVN